MELLGGTVEDNSAKYEWAFCKDGLTTNSNAEPNQL